MEVSFLIEQFAQNKQAFDSVNLIGIITFLYTHNVNDFL